MSRRCALLASRRASGFAVRSKAVVALGGGDHLDCSSGCKGSDHGIGLRNRTCFRITGSPDGPFRMRVGNTSVAMLNARFGIGTSTRSSSVATALIRNSVHFRNTGRGVIVAPGRRLAFGQSAGGISIGRVSASAFAT